MQPFTTLTSRIIPLPFESVDTDQIIPARYLKAIDKKNLAEGLFYDWRYRKDGSLIPEFPLNQNLYQNRQILLTGENFGCGSSREHAPWALMGWGIRAILSVSFADIFRNNALKNGLLPVVIDQATSQRLFELTRQESKARNSQSPTLDATNYQVTIDLSSQVLQLPDGFSAHFPIDAFSKTCLLQGIDQLGYLLGLDKKIKQYEKNQTLGFSGVQPL